MRKAREVSKKAAFPAILYLLTFFKVILWIWTSLQNDQDLMPDFLSSRDMIEPFHFLTAIENGK